MGEYLLILTLLANGGNDGQGGVATVKLSSQVKCEEVGEIWLQSLKSKDSHWGFSTESSFYNCIEVGVESK